MDNPPEKSDVCRVLVIDDRFNYGQFIKDMGDLLSCETLVTTNFSTAAQHIVGWKPHLLILDMHLPQDAWEAIPSIRGKYDPTQKSLAFCEQTRRHPQLRSTMVIFVSVDNQPEQKKLAKAAGAHGYFTKDQFNAEKLEAIIKKIREKTMSPKPPPDAPSPNPPAEEKPDQQKPPQEE